VACSEGVGGVDEEGGNRGGAAKEGGALQGSATVVSVVSAPAGARGSRARQQRGRCGWQQHYEGP